MSGLPLFHHSPEDIIAHRRGHPVTAKEFVAHVKALALVLPEPKYAVNLCEDHYLFLVGMAAAWLKGHQVLLPPNRAPEAVNEVIAGHSSAYCLVDGAEAQSAAAGLKAIGPPVVVEMGEYERGDTYQVPCLEPHRTVITLYTSGSTGRSVGQRKCWGELVEGVRLTGERLNRHMAAGTTVVSTVPAQHMFGLEACIMATLVNRLVLLAERPFFPEDIRRAVHEEGPSPLLVTSPLHLRACVEAGLQWTSLRFALTATAPLDAELAARAETMLSCPVYEIYGSTETGAIATRRTAKDKTWLPIEGVEVTADEGGAVIRASHLPAPVQLMDLVEMGDEGRFTLRGRVGDMVKLAGNRISLAELNQRLLSIPGVKDGVFFLPDSETTTPRLAAIVVAPEVDDSTILTALRLQVDPVFLPRPLLRADRLPRSETGKLPRTALLSFVARLRYGTN